MISDVCPVLGMPMFKGVGVMHDGSPSSPDFAAAGYVPGNVAVDQPAENTIKQDCTSAEVRAVGEWMKSHGV